MVLIIGGSGPINRDGNTLNTKPNFLKQLSDELQQNGVAVARYDKRMVGESNNFQIAESELGFADFINDATTVAEQLKKDNRFSKIYILGHSEGSLIAMVVANKIKVDGLILVSAPAISLDKLIIEQLKPYKNSEISDSAISILDKLNQGKLSTDVPTPLLPLFRTSVQGYLISEFKYDPAKEIAKLNTRILLIHGTADTQVLPNNADILNSNSKNSKKVIINGMNHVLKTTFADQEKIISSYTNDDLPLSEGLISNIIDFINTSQ